MMFSKVPKVCEFYDKFVNLIDSGNSDIIKTLIKDISDLSLYIEGLLVEKELFTFYRLDIRDSQEVQLNGIRHDLDILKDLSIDTSDENLIYEIYKGFKKINRSLFIMKYNEKDLEDAILHYNTLYDVNIIKEDLVLQDCLYLNPEDFFEGDFKPCDVKGWLQNRYGLKDWIDILEELEKRPFKNVVIKYLEGRIDPIIIINNVLCDGFGRVLFFHAIGKNIPTVKFRSARD